MRVLSEVVKVFDLEPFEAGEGDLYRFRLEVTRELSTGLFRGNVYRLETFRLQPTFPQQKGQLPDWQADALIHVVDDYYDRDLLSGRSVDEVLEQFQRALADRFG